MAKAFTFELQGMKRVEELLKKLPGDVHAEIMDEIEDTARTTVKKAKQRAPKFDGQLQQAIGYGFLSDKSGFEVFAAKDYAAFVEFGTGGKMKVPSELSGYAAQFKGSKSGSWDEFVDRMEKWVKKKGLAKITNSYTGKSRTKKSDVRMIAILIARSILRNGLTPHPFLFPSWFEERGKLVNKIKQVLKLK